MFSRGGLLRKIKRRVSVVGSVALLTLFGSALLASSAMATPTATTPPGINPQSASTTLSPQPGDTLTNVPANWSPSPPPADSIQWYDCDSSGNPANCQLIVGASGPPGSTYTVQPSDVGHTIEVWETAADTSGPTVVASSQTLVVGSPSNTSPPTISGTAKRGKRLTTSNGSWSNNPTSFGYQWSDCNRSGHNCHSIGGATSQSYTLTARDVGSRVEAQVTAANAGGSASATSLRTIPVAPNAISTVLGTLKSTMNWAFFFSPTYTRILTLIVHQALAGTTVAVACHGRGCPFTTRSAVVAKTAKPPTVDLSSWFRNQRIAPPATVTVQLTRPHWIGKVYVFSIRASHAPGVRILCKAPGAKYPKAGC